jgi:hypothetical protein
MRRISDELLLALKRKLDRDKRAVREEPGAHTRQEHSDHASQQDDQQQPLSGSLHRLQALSQDERRWLGSRFKDLARVDTDRLPREIQRLELR